MTKFAFAAVLALSSALPWTAAHAADPTPNCSRCAEWNTEQEPFALYGNSYYVGVHGLSSVLITSPAGHVLIDGDLPQSAPLVAAHIRALGFRVEDIKYILSSHAHFDHAGGIAQLQRWSGATVLGSPSNVQALAQGHTGKDDPQYGDSTGYEPVANTRAVRDGEVLRVGALAITAHWTPGHTPGGTSWTWQSCEDGVCKNMVYADSVTAFSNDSFKYLASPDYPNAAADVEHSIATLRNLPCDVLVSAHPEASDLWTRAARRAEMGSKAFIDTGACRRYADQMLEIWQERLAQEHAAH